MFIKCLQCSLSDTSLMPSPCSYAHIADCAQPGCTVKKSSFLLPAQAVSRGKSICPFQAIPCTWLEAREPSWQQGQLLWLQGTISLVITSAKETWLSWALSLDLLPLSSHGKLGEAKWQHNVTAHKQPALTLQRHPCVLTLVAATMVAP